MLEKTLGSHLDWKEIKALNPKGNQPSIFIGKTDAEAENPILWSPDMMNWLIREDPDAGKDWKQEKGMTEDKTVGCHHWLNTHEFEQAPENGEWEKSLGHHCPRRHEELDTTDRLNNNNTILVYCI